MPSHLHTKQIYNYNSRLYNHGGVVLGNCQPVRISYTLLQIGNIMQHHQCTGGCGSSCINPKLFAKNVAQYTPTNSTGVNIMLLLSKWCSFPQCLMGNHTSQYLPSRGCPSHCKSEARKCSDHDKLLFWAWLLNDTITWQWPWWVLNVAYNDKNLFPGMQNVKLIFGSHLVLK